MMIWAKILHHWVKIWHYICFRRGASSIDLLTLGGQAMKSFISIGLAVVMVLGTMISADAGHHHRGHHKHHKPHHHKHHKLHKHHGSIHPSPSVMIAAMFSQPAGPASSWLT
jgi:hypothetical protein